MSKLSNWIDNFCLPRDVLELKKTLEKFYPDKINGKDSYVTIANNLLKRDDTKSTTT